MSLRGNNNGSLVKPGVDASAVPTPTYTYYLNTWGTNSVGQLGLSNLTYYSSPKQVGSTTDWTDVASGSRFTVAVKTDGTLWAWGRNGVGQLGIGVADGGRSSPVQVGALTNWSVVTAGYEHVVALKTDGTLWSWGRGGSGRLGLSNITTYSSPMQVGLLTNWLTISTGYYHTAAVKTDGSLWVWGGNSFGTLGLNNTIAYSSPKQLGALTNWLKVVASFYNTYAVKTDGTMWGWGYNAFGQLGLSNLTYYSSPKQIGVLTTWRDVGTASYSTYAIRTSGNLWSWGRNHRGQLGLNNTTYYSSPKQIGTSNQWQYLPKDGNNSEYMMAIDSYGGLYAWGRNNVGQLGLGNTTYKSSPVQVGGLYRWYKVSRDENYATKALVY